MGRRGGDHFILHSHPPRLQTPRSTGPPVKALESGQLLDHFGLGLQRRRMRPVVFDPKRTFAEPTAPRYQTIKSATVSRNPLRKRCSRGAVTGFIAAAVGIVELICWSQPDPKARNSVPNRAVIDPGEVDIARRIRRGARSQGALYLPKTRRHRTWRSRYCPANHAYGYRCRWLAPIFRPN